MDKTTGYTYWTTQSEMAFIDKLGFHRKHGATSRSRLLIQYIKAMKLRKDWSGLDKDVILEHAKKVLDGEYI